MAVEFAIKFFNGPNGKNLLLGNLAVISKAKNKKDYVIEPFNANKLLNAWY
jgi:hypothetical protein